MEKNELIRTLLNASELEETHSSVIAKFFLEDFDWGPVEKDKVKEVKTILGTIRNQTMNHEKIINNLVSMIRESNENEF
jgi:mannitol/fructose-specific phosphotransferase system IIA component (Ntr-type)